MFNLYLRGCLPFTDVFIHAMIQDGEGRKMSKSLGNGVDPLDIISSHGADAMRFTLTNMATNTQDVRMPVVRDEGTGKNTSPKFDIGRNFCNKLWNAARFAMMQLEGSGFRVQGSGTESGSPSSPEPSTLNPEPFPPVDESKWSLADRWIVSRFNRTVEAADAALADYRFDQYAKACYDFFWGDFCDWYVEAAKPALRDPARKSQAQHVLAATLDGALRLMHPMIPFITEVLYQRLNELRPQRGLPNRLECHSALGAKHSGLLIRSPWPSVGSFSEAAEHIFPKLQEIITAIRNLRNQYNVPPKQSVAVTLLAPAEPTRQLTENREAIELLATCTIKEVGPNAKPAANAVRAAAAGVEIYVQGLVDESAEAQRVEKLREDLTKKIATLKGRLSNEAYISKAPPNLVKQTQDQLAEAEAELKKLA
jgi:valyl-tRNA synthetase